MASITSSINLIDNMSPVLVGIVNAIDTVIYKAEVAGSVIDNAFSINNTAAMNTSLVSASNHMNEVSTAANAVENSVGTTVNIFQRFDTIIDQSNHALQTTNVQLNNIESNLIQNTNHQRQFNNALSSGESAANGILNSLKGIAATYLSIQGIKGMFSESDEYTQTQARLNLMVDNEQQLVELQNQILASAQRSRSAYEDTADAVAKFSLNAGHAFDNTAQVIQFAENMNKMFKVSGASAQDQAGSMLQLTQALASGTLRGEELNSVLENAPLVARGIEKYMGWAEGSIKNYASDGVLTSEIVRNAVLSMTDDINEKFETMPMTWNDAWTEMKNIGTYVFQDLYQEMNNFLNSDTGSGFMAGVSNGLIFLSNVAMGAFQVFEWGADLVMTNWDIAGSALIGIAGAIGVAMTVAAAKAIVAWTLANWPLALIAVAIGGVIYALTQFGFTSSQIFGGFCGGINVAKEAVVNFGELMKLTWDALGAGADATAQNFVTAFKNGFLNVKAWFWDMESSIIEGIANICEKLNKIPGVDIDTSGLYTSAQTASNLANNARGQKGEYIDVGAAMDEAASKYSPFESGWITNAFDEGYSWGSNFVDSIGEKYDSFNNLMNTYSADKLASAAGLNNINLGNIESSLDGIDKNTKGLTKNTSLSATDIQYMLDIASRKSIDRYTTSKINVNITNNNSMNSDLDLDGITNKMSKKVLKQIQEEWSSGVSR